MFMRELRGEVGGRKELERGEGEKDVRIGELVAEVERLGEALKAAGGECDAERRARESIEAEAKEAAKESKEALVVLKAQGEARLNEGEARMNELEEEKVWCVTELERSKAENEALQSEVARLSGDGVKQLQLERRRSSELQDRLDEMSKGEKNICERSWERSDKAPRKPMLSYVTSLLLTPSPLSFLTSLFAVAFSSLSQPSKPRRQQTRSGGARSRLGPQSPWIGRDLTSGRSSS
jgi:hypothetical protein